MMSRLSKHKNNMIFVLFAFLAILLSSLACTIDMGGDSSAEELALQQTAVSLQLTQTAMDNAQEQATEETVPDVEEPDVAYEGISFSFDPGVAQGVVSATIPGQNMGEEYMPSETYPTHVEFNFNGYAVADHFHTPAIIVYPVDEFRAISTYASDIIDSLQAALINHPAGGVNSNLPFLPMYNAAQIFTAQVGYFDFQNGSGVRYLTMYGQAIYPVDNQNLFYTYQGLTDDGQYYITAILPVTHPELPDDGASEMDDWAAFDAAWETYISDTVDWLDYQDTGAFFPDLGLLDSMMASFLINR